ncbi:DUF1015 domain-containing protein [Thermodesulfovibrio yellowstonii]|uniref:DUF1015 domain-containing protein n=1 Tax=Thermodesulfovibrio yellowstonii TaxID=28262 RepID=UPI00041984C2|nr:DUF1015 domain-containing protein [Thermodesulfovibrio islandicus]
MTIIKPFKGIVYNPEKINEDDVMCPPYDIISDELKETLYNKSPYNIVRIDYGKNSPDVDKYSLAKQYLNKWLEEGILIQEKEPCFYGYEIHYSYKNKKKILRGIIGTVKIEEFGKGIYPHEQTYSKPKTDRLNLMKACMANTSLIFSIYRSKERITSQILEKLKTPYLQARDLNGNIHRLFKIKEPAQINKIVEEFKNKPIFIADGHHRYEVALEFKKQMNELYPEQKDSPWNYVLMFLTNIEDDGYLILPTHRLLSTSLPVKEQLENQNELFNLFEFNKDEDIQEAIEKMGPKNMGVYLKDNKFYILQYKGPCLDYLPEELRYFDVNILEEVILKKMFPQREVCYDIDIEKGIKMVQEGKCDAIFILRATKVEEIERVALAGLRMPPKSTYFYPKLLTGMVINSFKENFK